MLDASNVFYLAMFTLGTVLVIGGWQYVRVKQKIDKNESKEELFKR